MIIFLSRFLDNNSKFQNLKKQNIKIIDTSLIDFKSVDFEPFNQADWIFFYSKNAVRFYFQKLKFDHSIKYACFGPSTAHFFKKLTSRFPSFIGTGEVSSTKIEFLHLVRSDDCVFFPRAEHSMNSLMKEINENCICQDVVIYSNRPKVDIDIPIPNIQVFTSPLNVKTYTHHYPERMDILSVAIGTTTANEMYNQGYTQVKVSNSPSEDALYNTVMEALGLM